GVDTDRFQNVPGSARESVRTSLGLGNEFVWLAVGRFEVAKDYPNMLRAFARVREAQKDTVLLLVGGGSLQGETEALTRSLGLTSAVRFLGMRPDVPELMSAADAYVMSSAWEGMPLVLLEAAAAGLPVVATLVGGNQEVVLHEETGLLVPPNHSDSLGDAMLRLMRSPEAERRSMGRRGREYVQRQYRLGRVVDRWEEVYHAVRARQGLELTAPTSP
ncbi:MAG TPA: glycosyltransferase, partial [Gemmatimonadales bacterium]|nr:glycosyltransferase [Gemmatimonadales bacterium]